MQRSPLDGREAGGEGGRNAPRPQAIPQRLAMPAKREPTERRKLCKGLHGEARGIIALARAGRGSAGRRIVKDLIWPFGQAEDIGYILWPVAAGGVISLGALLIILSFVWP